MPDETPDAEDTTPSDIPLRVDIVRTGGFGGTSRRSSVQLASLPEQDARELGTALAKLEEEAASAGRSGSARDAFQYRLTITYPDHQRDVSLSDASASPEVRALLARLNALGAPS